MFPLGHGLDIEICIFDEGILDPLRSQPKQKKHVSWVCTQYSRYEGHHLAYDLLDPTFLKTKIMIMIIIILICIFETETLLFCSTPRGVTRPQCRSTSQSTSVWHYAIRHYHYHYFRFRNVGSRRSYAKWWPSYLLYCVQTQETCFFCFGWERSGSSIVSSKIHISMSMVCV